MGATYEIVGAMLMGYTPRLRHKLRVLAARQMRVPGRLDPYRISIISKGTP
jgi:hypothetical protein